MSEKDIKRESLEKNIGDTRRIEEFLLVQLDFLIYLTKKWQKDLALL